MTDTTAAFSIGFAHTKTPTESHATVEVSKSAIPLTWIVPIGILVVLLWSWFERRAQVSESDG